MSECLCKCIVTLSSNSKEFQPIVRNILLLFLMDQCGHHMCTQICLKACKSPSMNFCEDASINYPSHNNLKAAAGKLAKKKLPWLMSYCRSLCPSAQPEHAVSRHQQLHWQRRQFALTLFLNTTVALLWSIEVIFDCDQSEHGILSSSEENRGVSKASTAGDQ